MVLTGFRGHGKHFLLNNSLRRIQHEYDTAHNTTGTPGTPFARIIHLNALTLPDEHSCHREIAAQLSAQTVSSSRSSYLNNTDLFHRSLLHTRADNTPLLFVLTDLDHFALQSKQVFLYTLLDAISNPQYWIGIIGITSRLNMLELYERRIRSRSCQIQINIPRYKYTDMRRIILAHLTPAVNSLDNESFLDTADVQHVLRRAHNVGSSPAQFVNLCFVLNALPPPTSVNNFISNFTIAATASGINTSSTGDFRKLAVMDLDQPSLITLVCAGRVVRRNLLRDDCTTPLTFTEILVEYKDYLRRGGGGAGRVGGNERYTDEAVFAAFMHLFDVDVVRFEQEHSGGGALQYDYKRIENVKSSGVHVTVDIDQELWIMLRGRELAGVSTTLREWALKL